MLRRGPFAAIIAMLAGVLVLHVGVGVANRKSGRGACTGATTVPVDENTRREATVAVLCLVNRFRAGHGLRRVHPSIGLTVAALQHSNDMVQRRYFSHDGLALLRVEIDEQLVDAVAGGGVGHPRLSIGR